MPSFVASGDDRGRACGVKASGDGATDRSILPDRRNFGRIAVEPHGAVPISMRPPRRKPMKCPIDDAELTIAERQGIEIDYCPKCRGVWLDRGELDKIIERSEQRAPRAYRDDSDRYRDRDERRPYKKKKSILGEIFDF
jgi:Zn-finger nucleic acid-binding protein